MIVNEHVRDYINSLESNEKEELEELRRWAEERQVPIIRREAGALLSFLLQDRKPERILEIGTAVGFSALFMESHMPDNCTITTIEKVEMRLVHARENLAGHDRITLLEGDAAEVLRELADEENKYDFVFLDAAKAQYMTYLEQIMRMLVPGGILVTDNVLQEGRLCESKFAVERRDRTIHMRMREYMYAITHDERLNTVVLPVGDGMTLSTRLST